MKNRRRKESSNMKHLSTKQRLLNTGVLRNLLGSLPAWSGILKLAELIIPFILVILSHPRKPSSLCHCLNSAVPQTTALPSHSARCTLTILFSNSCFIVNLLPFIFNLIPECSIDILSSTRFWTFHKKMFHSLTTYHRWHSASYNI